MCKKWIRSLFAGWSVGRLVSWLKDAGSFHLWLGVKYFCPWSDDGLPCHVDLSIHILPSLIWWRFFRHWFVHGFPVTWTCRPSYVTDTFRHAFRDKLFRHWVDDGLPGHLDLPTNFCHQFFPPLIWWRILSSFRRLKRVPRHSAVQAMSAADSQPTQTQKRRRLRRLLSEDVAMDITPIPRAQSLLSLPQGVSLGIVPGDGDCFFYCVQRGLNLETNGTVLREFADCPPGVWADESHIAKICTRLNFRVSVYPVDTERARAGLDLEKMQATGPHLILWANRRRCAPVLILICSLACKRSAWTR